MPTTIQLAEALVRQGLAVLDRRGSFPTHPTRRFAERAPDAIAGLCLHHSAGRSGGVSRVQAIADYHVSDECHVPTSGGGAPGILYTLAVTDEGQVVLCHDLDVATWSQGTRTRAGDENADFLAVLVVGDFTSDNHPASEPTAAQMRAVASVFLAVRELWGPEFEYTGHYALGKPACPGDTLRAMVEAADSHREIGVALVTQAQVTAALTALGYANVQAFQRHEGLQVDGIVGPITRERLEARANAL